ncbi:MAG: hypothetical protein IJA82_00725 [Clostridia bacterium]|nr:hypothetical protein [Clostridia bacterium]
MFPFESIAKLFSFNFDEKYCIEIEFSIKGYPKYQFCWMGKMPDKENTEKELYWYGLTSDGSEAYDYDNFQDFYSAPIFDGKSIKEIWDKVDLLSIDGCDPKERLAVYL